MIMTLSNIRPAPGARHRAKRLGRGEGSGHGQTSTRGMKGQGSRSGETRMAGFEGGQTPLVRRLPKRGFNNKRFKKYYAVVNTGLLEKHFDTGATITVKLLVERRIVPALDWPVKILGGGGPLTKQFFIEAHGVSVAAKAAIEKVGGRLNLLPAAAHPS